MPGIVFTHLLHDRTIPYRSREFSEWHKAFGPKKLTISSVVISNCDFHRTFFAIAYYRQCPGQRDSEVFVYVPRHWRFPVHFVGSGLSGFFFCTRERISNFTCAVVVKPSEYRQRRVVSITGQGHVCVNVKKCRCEEDQYFKFLRRFCRFCRSSVLRSVDPFCFYSLRLTRDYGDHLPSSYAADGCANPTTSDWLCFVLGSTSNRGEWFPCGQDSGRLLIRLRFTTRTVVLVINFANNSFFFYDSISPYWTEALFSVSVWRFSGSYNEVRQ